jgi:hypothetical protein
MSLCSGIVVLSDAICARVIGSVHVLCLSVGYIVEKAEHYVGFFAAQELSESFEEDITWIDFRQEMEALSVDGSWTSRAADLDRSTRCLFCFITTYYVLI